MATDQDQIRYLISLQTDMWVEKKQSIRVVGGPKYNFRPDGKLSSIRIGDRYYPADEPGRKEDDL